MNPSAPPSAGCARVASVERLRPGVHERDAEGGPPRGRPAQEPPSRELAAQSGSLLVVTLWLVAILSVLAVAIGRYLSTEVRLTKYRLARNEAQALARSGVYLALQRLEQDAQGETDGGTYDWLGDDWAVPQDVITTDQGALTISMTDEERKLNVNAAMRPVLEPLSGSPELAAAIVAYADANEDPPQETPPYYPKNSPVVAIEELTEIPDAATALDRLQALLTASTEPQTPPTLNINTVEGDILLALGGDPAAVAQLIGARPGPNGLLGDDDDCKATDAGTITDELEDCAFAGDPAPMAALWSLANFVVTSSTFRIEADALVKPSQVRYRVVAIVKRSSDPATPSTILSWREG